MGDASGIGNRKLGGSLQVTAVQQGRFDYLPNKVEIETFQQGNISLKIPPQTSLTTAGPWLFNLPSMETHALDMSSIETYWRAKIVNANGSACIGVPMEGEAWPFGYVATEDVRAPKVRNKIDAVSTPGELEAIKRRLELN